MGLFAFEDSHFWKTVTVTVTVTASSLRCPYLRGSKVRASIGKNRGQSVTDCPSVGN